MFHNIKTNICIMHMLVLMLWFVIMMHGECNVKIMFVFSWPSLDAQYGYTCFNLLKPSSTLHTKRFNIQKFYMVFTLRLYVLYGSQNKQRLVPCTALTDRFSIKEVERVYCAVGTESRNLLSYLRNDRNIR